MMMMMLTTQLAYTPTLSASARSQALQSNTPFTTNNPSTAIGLVETDAYEATNPSTPIVGTPQVRSGKIGMIGVAAFMLVAAFVTAIMANKQFREIIKSMFERIAGVKHEESSSHRKEADLSEKPHTLQTKATSHRHSSNHREQAQEVYA